MSSRRKEPYQDIGAKAVYERTLKRREQSMIRSLERAGYLVAKAATSIGGCELFSYQNADFATGLSNVQFLTGLFQERDTAMASPTMATAGRMTAVMRAAGSDEGTEMAVYGMNPATGVLIKERGMSRPDIRSAAR